jgi:hypothetical protein
MRKVLLFIVMALAMPCFAQNYPVTSINISLPSSPDANTANWGSGVSMLTITATTKAQNGRVDPHVMESKLLVTIKKGGTKICGDFSGNSAPASNFNSVNKVWSGANAASYLGKGWVLAPGDYEICVQFFGYGAAGATALSEEKCKSFSIRGIDTQAYQPPQNISPADGTSMAEADLKKPITFRWTPVVPRPQEPVTYHLTVWQLMQGQTDAQAIKVNQPIIIKDVENMTQYVLNSIVNGPCRPPLICGFIWNVQALNKEGKPVGENNGTSVAAVFNFTNEKPLDNNLKNACSDFGVNFMQDRKIYKGDSITSRLNTDFVQDHKIYKGDSITLSVSITNNYKGKDESKKPKTFKLKIKDGSVFVAAESTLRGWTGTPSKFPPGLEEIKWTNNSGDIPNGKTNLGSICFGSIKTSPITVICEWLNKDEKVICSKTLIINRN